jgi:hypothetical protein
MDYFFTGDGYLVIVRMPFQIMSDVYILVYNADDYMIGKSYISNFTCLLQY